MVFEIIATAVGWALFYLIQVFIYKVNIFMLYVIVLTLRLWPLFIRILFPLIFTLFNQNSISSSLNGPTSPRCFLYWRTRSRTWFSFTLFYFLVIKQLLQLHHEILVFNNSSSSFPHVFFVKLSHSFAQVFENFLIFVFVLLFIIFLIFINIIGISSMSFQHSRFHWCASFSYFKSHRSFVFGLLFNLFLEL